MRDWNLGPSDPLALTLAADFRLSSTDYVNDQIWELETGGGDPPALALHTTFGLRARADAALSALYHRQQNDYRPGYFYRTCASASVLSKLSALSISHLFPI